LLFEDPTPDDSQINPFFLTMLGSITRACALRGYDLLISFQQMSSDWHKEYEDSRKADGIILLGYGDYLAYQSRLEQLVSQGTHFVRWGAVQAGQPGLSIGCDNFRGGYDATAPPAGHWAAGASPSSATPRTTTRNSWNATGAASRQSRRRASIQMTSSRSMPSAPSSRVSTRPMNCSRAPRPSMRSSRRAI
jgi:hypothetical protein